jgi:23S rRNA pseudouridine1911/1915/1917 synthase
MLEILYDNGPCLVVAKPAGLLTQAPAGIDSLEARLKQERGLDYLGVVHRLDRPATGAMVVGLTRKAAWKLSKQFEQRWVHKTYWVVVEGEVAPAAGTWVDTIRKVPDEPRAEISPDGREAVLHYVVRGQGPWGTWLEVELGTGRTHQIRVQAASRGHPVLGDAQYGASGGFGPVQDDERLRAIALHSRSLGFRDPTSREDVTVVAPLPASWEVLGLPTSSR